MSIPSAIAIYFVIWWTVLFAVLPWGAKSQREAGHVVPGSEPGAPHAPRLLRIVLSTTLVATLAFALVWAVIVQDIVTLDDLTWFPGGRTSR